MATALYKRSGKTRSGGEGNDHGGDAQVPVPQSHLSDTVAKELVRLFKLLADETRLRILYYLLNRRELNVRSLCELLGQSQPAVSHHLALLRVDGLIACRRDGKHNYYHLIPERFDAFLSMMFGVSPDGESKIEFKRYVLGLGRVTGTP